MYKAKVRKAASRTESPAPRAASDEGRATVPNSANVGADAASDPALAEKMQSRMSANFPGIDLLSRGSGRPLALPDDLRGGLEAHFGASLDNIRFRESSDAADLGAKAYARGDEIHFAPGQFRPDTASGRKMIGHEVSHIARQASGGMGNGVLLDDAQERQADLDGEAIASGETAPRHAAAPLSPMPVAPFDAAPAQGWELGEHGILTELARKKASDYARTAAEKGVEPPKNFANLSVKERAAALESASGNRNAYQRMTRENEFDSEKAKKSLAYGAKFNDVGHHSLGGFVLNYKNHRSAFINQTHHGDMQFLHSMDTSGGDTEKNMLKARRYAQFASDVYQNKRDQSGQDVQSQNMLDYVLRSKTRGDDGQAREDKLFQEMMLSTMLSAKKTKSIEEQVEKEVKKGLITREQSKARRAQLIRDAAIAGRNGRQAAADEYRNMSDKEKKKAGSEDKYIRKKTGLSKYATGSVGDFFTGGNEELDAGLVALGSASHMIEDSYAGSHASRAENLYLGDGGRKATDLSETGEEIAAKSTDVITSADYNQQDATFKIGRHTKGDKFAETDSDDLNAIADNTRGGALARDAAAQFMLMNAREKYGRRRQRFPQRHSQSRPVRGVDEKYRRRHANRDFLREKSRRRPV